MALSDDGAGAVVARATTPSLYVGTQVAPGEPVIKGPSPLNVLKYTYDRSCY